MKKALWVVVTVAMLAGCVSAPAVNDTTTLKASTTIAVATTRSATEAPLATACPVTVDPTVADELETEEPLPSLETKQPEPSPTPDEWLNTIWPLDPSEQNGSRFSSIAVTDGYVVYFRRDYEITNQIDSNGYSARYTKIYRYNKKTGKKQLVLNTKGIGYVFSMLLDKGGSLYIELSDNNYKDKPTRLYRVHNKKLTLLQNDINIIDDIRGDTILYSRELPSQDDTLLDQYEQISYNVATGEKKVTRGDNSNSIQSGYTDDFRLHFDAKADGTDLTIINLVDHIDTTFHINLQLIEPMDTFIYEKVLVILDWDREKQMSHIYQINLKTHTVQNVIPINGLIDDSTFYHGRWYLYSYKSDPTDESIYNEMISALDLSTGYVSFLASIKTSNEAGLYNVWIEAGCGFIWVYTRGGGDGSYLEFMEQIKIPTSWYR